jgi:hypothetical protein
MKKAIGPLIGISGFIVLLLRAVIGSSDDPSSDSLLQALFILMALLFIVGTIVTGKQKGRLGIGIVLAFFLALGFIIILFVPAKKNDTAIVA